MAGASGKATLEAVADHDQDVLDAAVAQLVADPQPEPRALVGLDPDAEDLLAAIGIDAEDDVCALLRITPSSRTLQTSASR